MCTLLLYYVLKFNLPIKTPKATVLILVYLLVVVYFDRQFEMYENTVLKQAVSRQNGFSTLTFHYLPITTIQFFLNEFH